MKIKATIEEVTLENDNGKEIDGVMATCERCAHTTESFGTSQRSISRCLVLLRLECPEEEENFYIPDDEDEAFL